MFYLFRQRHARGNGHDSSLHPIRIQVAPVDVLRSAPPPTDPGGASHHFGKQRAHIAAISQKMPVAAMVGYDQIVWLQGGNYAHCIGFLTNRSVGCTSENAAFKLLKDGFFKAADTYHATVKIKIGFH